MAACESLPQDINGQVDDITCGLASELNKLNILQRDEIDDERLHEKKSEDDDDDSKHSLPDSPTLRRLNVNAQIFKPKQNSQSSDGGDSQEGGSGNGEGSPRSLDSSHFNSLGQNMSSMTTEEVMNRWRDDDRSLTNGSQYLGTHNPDTWTEDIIRAVSNGTFNDQRQDTEIGSQRGGNQRPRRDPKVADPMRVSRTIFVTDIDQMVTEEQLAKIFSSCGSVVDCRVCGDPNSALRFAVIEFASKEDAEKSLELNGITLGNYPIRVTKSRTAIIPVNSAMLPKDETERELCSRTIYVANIDKSVSQVDVKLFFESLCGVVTKLRLLGDFEHPTRIAFVEFEEAKSATNALNCSGAILGKTPIRVSPSKTPVRPRSWSHDTRGRGGRRGGGAGYNRGDRRQGNGQSHHHHHHHHHQEGQRHRGFENINHHAHDYGRNGHSAGNGMGYYSHYSERQHTRNNLGSFQALSGQY